MVILCSTCEKEEKECIQVKYLIYKVCRDFKFVVIYAFFPPNVHSQSFGVKKKKKSGLLHYTTKLCLHCVH